MAVFVRSLGLALAAIAFATARAHISSHDNILRIQLWDAEGLSRDPITTQSPTQPPKHKLKVNLDLLNNAMLEEGYGSFARFTRHKVRHKRRRPRESDSYVPWSFHSGKDLNVAVYDDNVPWKDIEKDAMERIVNTSVVSASVNASAEGNREVSPPMKQRQDGDEGEDLPIVPKCCESGQNLSMIVDAEGQVEHVCARTTLTFQPLFYMSNDTHFWQFDSNIFETIVGNPCKYGRYKLEPEKMSVDEFYLLFNGSLFMPYSEPPLLGTKDFCMESVWSDANPAGLTVPMVCFTTATAETTTPVGLIAYAVALLISVPFLLVTAFVYTCFAELRDIHGKVLACHSICLAVAFFCLAITQLAGHAFSVPLCTTMAYLIQFSFVSCFFWLNVMCFDIFLNVRRYINSSVPKHSSRRRFVLYCLYAILFPVLLLIVTIVMDLVPSVPSTYLKPSFGVKSCWFKTDLAALPYFYGPVAAVLITNVILFILTARNVNVHYNKLKDLSPVELALPDYSSNSEDWVRLGTVTGQTLPLRERPPTPPQETSGSFRQRIKKYRKILCKCYVLSAIMGLTWGFEIVSWVVGDSSSAVSVWAILDLINALQGVAIFIIFVLTKQVRTMVWSSKLFRWCKRKKDDSEVLVHSQRYRFMGFGKRDYV